MKRVKCECGRRFNRIANLVIHSVEQHHYSTDEIVDLLIDIDKEVGIKYNFIYIKKWGTLYTFR